VYLAILPALVYLETPAWNVLTAVGVLVCIGATLLEMVADVQMQRFRKRANAGEMITTGLWKNARHPNYLGEILMWWGVYLVLLSCGGAWYYGIGALINTLMFLFISIPMAEKRLMARKPDYAQHIRRTRILLPFPKKQEQEVEETRAL
jgi:steroid 5-alpha reductase family enzyme